MCYSYIKHVKESGTGTARERGKEYKYLGFKGQASTLDAIEILPGCFCSFPCVLFLLP